MKFKLLFCNLLTASLVLSPFANNPIDATLPICSIDGYSSDKSTDTISETDDSSDDEYTGSKSIEPEESSEEQKIIVNIETCPSDQYEECIVGRYLNTKGTSTDNTESHHLISSNFCKTFGLNVNDAPAIRIPHRLHERTGSYGKDIKAQKYRENECEKCYEEIRKKVDPQKKQNKTMLLNAFKHMSPDDKYNCLRPILDMGIQDLKEKCNISLDTNTDCMQKLDAELKRLSGKDITKIPKCTPYKHTPIHSAFYRRKSVIPTFSATRLDKTNTNRLAHKRNRNELDEQKETAIFIPCKKKS